MAKLYFRYGTMGSAKTLNLLAVAHNYQQKNMNVFLIKPEMDHRFGVETIKSRAGLEKKADLLVQPDTNISYKSLENINCILVDEAQFLSEHVIDQLREISIALNIPSICYGLRTDFRGQLFPGAKRLFELADSIEEIKTICSSCEKKAIFNMKFIDNVPTLQGPTIDLGGEEKYLPVCSQCYFEKIHGTQPFVKKQQTSKIEAQVN